MTFILFLISLLFAFRVLKTLSFFIYLWQLKEYRFDRLWLYFQTKSGKKELKQHLSPFQWSLKPFFRPVWTKRAGLFFILSLCLVFLTAYWLFGVLRVVGTDFSWFRLLVFWLVLNWLISVIVFFSAALIRLPVWLIKGYLIKKAQKKMALRPDLLIIGVTGSFGKTSTVHILAKALGVKYRVLQTPENQNTVFAIAQLINKKLRKKHQVFVVEMGAYKRGEISEICRLVKPKIGIVTAINYQHLGLFKTFGSLLTAKYELIKALPEDGLAVFNATNKYTLAMAKKTKIKARLFGKDKRFYETNLIGSCQQSNIQAVLAVVDELKVRRQKALEAIKKIPAFPQQLKIKKGLNGAVIIDDSYSINYDGFVHALRLFKNYPGCFKIVITPGLIELGFKEKVTHRLLAKKILRAGVNEVVLTRPDSYEYFAKVFKTKKSKKPKLVIETDLERFKKHLKAGLNKRTVVLVEGRMPSGLIAFLTHKVK